jgi:hypothetical protein
MAADENIIFENGLGLLPGDGVRINLHEDGRATGHGIVDEHCDEPSPRR